MADPRFYKNARPVTLAEVAAMCGGTIVAGNETQQITHATSLDRVTEPHAIVFLTDQKKLPLLAESRGVVCLTRTELAEAAVEQGASVITVPFAQSAFARISDHLHKSYLETSDVAGLADPIIADTAIIAPTALISKGATIGDNVRIDHGAFIGPGCQIGDGSRVGVNAVVTHSVLGKDCQIMSGTVVGEAGFGYVLEKTADSEQQIRMPQIGRVILGDAVDIGANCTIDRGGLGDTKLGDHTKLDNLVHIGHNVVMGKNCVVAGQVGLSGSSIFGDRVMIGGQAGAADHLSIGNDTTLLARAGLMRNMPDGERWGGFPAQPARLWLREVAAIAKSAQSKKK